MMKPAINAVKRLSDISARVISADGTASTIIFTLETREPCRRGHPSIGVCDDCRGTFIEESS